MTKIKEQSNKRKMKKMKPKVMKRLQIEMERTPYIKKSIEDSNDKIENISNLIKDKKSSLSQEYPLHV